MDNERAILLFVSQKENARILKDLLLQKYHVDICGSAEELDTQTHGLIITDLIMLKQHSKVLEKLKKTQNSSVLPILLATARNDIKIASPFPGEVVDDLIFMPFEKTELLARVKVLLRNRELSVISSMLESCDTSLEHDMQVLKNSEQRFRKSQDISPEGFTILHPLRDDEGQIIDFAWVYQNLAIARINGTDPQKAVGRKLLDLFPEHKETAIYQAYIQVADTGETQVFDDVYVGEILKVPTWLRLEIVSIGEDIAIYSQNLTERKKAEMALVKSEARFRNIMASMNDTVFTLDKDQRHTGVYGPWVEKSGFTPEFFLGKTAREIMGAEHAKVHEKANIKAMKGEFVTYEWSVNSKSGTQYYQTTLSPIFNENREVEGLVGVGRDITEIRKAEKALMHSHELMQYIIEHNQSAIAVHDRNLNYIYVSQRYLDDYRVKEKDIIGKHHYQVFPDIPEKWRKVHQKALEGIVSRSDEDLFFRDDGAIDWTRWECRPWHEADGSIGGIIIYTEVINEQKRKEEEIKKLNHRLEILIDSIQQLSSAQSLKVVQDIVAKSARKLIGADGATLVFKENGHCFYANEDAIQPLWKGKRFRMDSCISGWVIQNKQPVIIEDVFTDNRIPKDVYKPTFVKSLAMVPLNVAEPIGAIGNYWEEFCTPTETEMQLLQTLANAAARAIENIQLYNELENRVNIRTEQLQLVNKELETFTYSVSHDLKAPLRHINGFVDLLNSKYKDDLPEKAHHYLDTISRASSQMGILIEELLQFSRTGRREVNKTQLDMNLLVKEVSDIINTGVTDRKIMWNIQHLPRVYGDYMLLKQVWVNLLENAVKYTAKKKIAKISIDYTQEDHFFIFSVIDNGVGFDMEYAHKLFGVFQRLHSQAEFEGSGIGLANVQRIVHKHMGRVWAEAKPGKGAKFYFSLPKSGEVIQ